MAMADGGIRFVNESMDYRAYQALMTLRGKSSDVPFPDCILVESEFYNARTAPIPCRMRRKQMRPIQYCSTRELLGC
ncbi:hypothetical protein Q31b_18220 [Novipirellula aureliae]|uniref:Uncharacterized protein n=1 Tax=Novipirellula aureliae TaxID=2527966 RepID=A0A5C6E9X1_9BACT|nr:hypothetical protein Q31b_18220 [Novipirellula aureliae]